MRLTVIGSRRAFAKTWDKSTKSYSYERPSARLTSASRFKFRDLDELADVLRDLEDKPNLCAIRGRPIEPRSLPLRRNREHFADRPERWVMLDIDGVPEAWDDPEAVRRHLPTEFQGVACVWQLSGSAGLDPAIAKMHLWFLLDRAVTCSELRAWLPRVSAIDRACLRSVQPLFTAAPIGGPCRPRGVQRVGLLEGANYVLVPTRFDGPVDPGVVAATKRPKGLPDLPEAFLAKSKKRLLTRAEQILADCSTTAYQDAYAVGCVLGRLRAEQTWSDRKGGHVLEPRKSPEQWGAGFATLEGAHPLSVYSSRVLEGMIWGHAERRRQIIEEECPRLQQTESVQRELGEAKLSQVLKRVAADPGPTRLKQAALDLAPYLDLLGRDVVTQALETASLQSSVDVEAAIAAAPKVTASTDAWRAGLELRPKTDIIKASEPNVERILRQYPEALESFAFNTRSAELQLAPGNVFALPAGPWDGDTHPGALALWLQDIGCPGVSSIVVRSCVKSVSPAVRAFDPFLELIGAELALSKKEAKHALREVAEHPVGSLSTWLVDHFGARNTAYVRCVSRKALIGAVARAVRPGAQVDTMLTLIGSQGIGKTKALRVLGGVIEGGYRELEGMAHKDNLMGIQGSLVVEVSEMRALRAANEDAAKSFLTRTVDVFRVPYAVQVRSYPRRCIFIGTSNDESFLSDSHNRRHWPVVCSSELPVELTAEQALALWREAALRYRAGERWWLEDDDVKAAQVRAAARARYVEPWEGPMRAFLKGHTRVKWSAVYEHVCQTQGSKPHSTAIVRALKAHGWVSKRTEKENYWQEK